MEMVMRDIAVTVIKTSNWAIRFFRPGETRIIMIVKEQLAAKITE